MHISRSNIQVIVWIVAATIVVVVAFLPSVILRNDDDETLTQLNAPILTKSVSAESQPLQQVAYFSAEGEQQQTTAFKKRLPEQQSIQKNKTKTLQPSSSWASFRNGNAQLGVAGCSLAEKLSVLWTIKDKDGFVSTAAIVEDDVIAGALSGTLYCINRKTGAIRWKYRSIKSNDPDDFAPGFMAAPRVTGDTIYIGDEEGGVHAVNRETGKMKWQFKTDAEIAGCVALVGKNVIVGSNDSFLYCLKANNGEVVWKLQTGDRINGSPAVVGNMTFVAGCDQHLRIVDINKGKELGNIPLESYLIASPAVMGDMLYVGTSTAEVVAINWKERNIVWRYQRKEKDFRYYASAAVTEEYVVVGGHNKRMHCINRKTGKEVWTYLTRAQINSSAVIVKNRVFFGSNDRNLYELELKTGKLISKVNLKNKITAGIAVGEECLVAGTEGANGILYCFGQKSKEEK